jgi:hypothetical protein
MLDALGDLTGIVQLALALPVVVLDAESSGRASLLCDELVAAGGREVRKPIGFRRRHPAVAVPLADTQSNRYQVLARIATLGQRKLRLQRLAVTRVDRAAQGVELPAGIVDDPLDKNFVAAKAHCVGKRCADRHRAPLNDDERSRWICATELEGYARAVRRYFPEAFVLAQNGG